MKSGPLGCPNSNLQTGGLAPSHGAQCLHVDLGMAVTAKGPPAGGLTDSYQRGSRIYEAKLGLGKRVIGNLPPSRIWSLFGYTEFVFLSVPCFLYAIETDGCLL